MTRPRRSPGSAPHGAEDELLLDGDLVSRWSRHWASSGAGPQIQDPGGRWMTGGELEERSARAAARLSAAGARPGDRCVLSAAVSADLVVAYVAALRAGLVVVPVNTAYTHHEVARIVRAACPRVVVVDDRVRSRWFETPNGTAPIVTDPTIALPTAGAAEPPSTGAGPGTPALLIFTSGTTGRPKGVELTHGNLLASATALGRTWRWDPDDRLLLTLPLFHLHGLGVGINGSLAAGAAISLRAGFDVTDVAATCEQGGVSLFFGVPAMYDRLLASGRAGALRSLRLLVSGSAPMAANLATAIGDGCGQLPLERYGMTETVMLTSNPLDGQRRPGTVGMPLPGVEVRLDQGSEIEVRGPNVFGGYLDDATENARAFTDDGWFRTGDLGTFDGDGYLSIIGRSKELIITGGYNVLPREVEDVLLAHPGVADAAVFGRASERWGEEVVAAVVRSSPVDAEALRAFVADRLASYKVPKVFTFREELPRNTLGKLVRAQL